MSKRTILRLRDHMFLAVGLTVFSLVGCSSPSEPSGPPTGGQRFVLDFESYKTVVAPIMERRTCGTGGDCHGGGIRGTFHLSPQSAKNLQFDFEQVVEQVWGYAPEESPLLQKPLDPQVGGTPHSYTAFTTVEDPDYQAILAWIREGVFE